MKIEITDLPKDRKIDHVSVDVYFVDGEVTSVENTSGSKKSTDDLGIKNGALCPSFPHSPTIYGDSQTEQVDNTVDNSVQNDVPVPNIKEEREKKEVPQEMMDLEL